MFRIGINYTPIAASSCAAAAATSSVATRSTASALQTSSSSSSASFLAMSSINTSAFLHQTQPLLFFAHWYAGRHKKHRWAREKRYHPDWQVRTVGRNRFSKKLFFKSNKWNYIQAYKDMP